MRWRIERKDYHKPHRWFAWRPVRTWDGERVWLERVWRHDIGNSGWGFGPVWEHHTEKDRADYMYSLWKMLER